MQAVKRIFTKPFYDDLEERAIPFSAKSEMEQLADFLGIELGGMNVKGKNSLKVATIYACIKILSESVSKLPVKIHQEDDDGIKHARKHYLTRLLRLRPNAHMSATTFFGALEAQRNIYGNSYAHIEYDKRGRVVALWPIDTAKVTIYVDDVGLLSTRNKIWYVVDTGKEQVKLQPYEVLHFKNTVTLDGLVGVPPIDQLKNTLENAAAAEQFINNFYKQGLQVKGLVQYVGDLNEDAKKNFREKFESMSSGLKNSHRIALMPVGYQYVPISLNMNDAQFLENNQMTVKQIANAYGIKSHQLNNLERSTHTNIEQQEQEFYNATLLSILTMYEQEMSYKLLLDSEIDTGYYLKFNVDAILRGDLKTRYEAYRIGIQGGFLMPNEARGKEDMAPAEGGDQLLVNGNVMPITMAGQAYVKNLKGGENTEQEQENG